MKTVTFGMVWQVSGRQSIDLPDDIDINDEDAVKDYIRENWSDIPLPGDGDYIPESDELDELVPLQITDDRQLKLPV